MPAVHIYKWSSTSSPCLLSMLLLLYIMAVGVRRPMKTGLPFASSPRCSLILIRHQPVDSPGFGLLPLTCADLQQLLLVLYISKPLFHWSGFIGLWHLLVLLPHLSSSWSISLSTDLTCYFFFLHVLTYDSCSCFYICHGRRYIDLFILACKFCQYISSSPTLIIHQRLTYLHVLIHYSCSYFYISWPSVDWHNIFRLAIPASIMRHQPVDKLGMIFVLHMLTHTSPS